MTYGSGHEAQEEAACYPVWVDEVVRLQGLGAQKLASSAAPPISARCTVLLDKEVLGTSLFERSVAGLSEDASVGRRCWISRRHPVSACRSACRRALRRTSSAR